MSKHVLKKDPGLPSRIWDAYYPPSTFGTTLFWSALGGRLKQQGMASWDHDGMR
jgi:hypothetical protein